MRKSFRRAYSLVELMAVMGIVTVLMALLGMFLSATLQTQRQAHLRSRQRAEFARLDGILRADAHAAARVTVKSPTECELNTDQGIRWTYSATAEGLVRERWQADRLRQREVFFLRPGMDVRFSSQPADRRTLLVLDLYLPPSEQKLEARQQPYHCETLIGGGISGDKKSAEEQP
ncbi:hypothetical protein [Anatilimnocola floriformis]|uniref:hypothetical protein n=1 Tax=Anatilimnocola floriformis TaxID=2948575 RepID=UPI0020C55A21|nr:hypothetical protein [Anatilimnocola floriformis]